MLSEMLFLKVIKMNAFITAVVKLFILTSIATVKRSWRRKKKRTVDARYITNDPFRSS